MTLEVTEDKRNDRRYLIFSLEDSGSGMEQEDQDRLTKILHNDLSLHQDNNYKNFGLGLLISN